MRHEIEGAKKNEINDKTKPSDNIENFFQVARKRKYIHAI